MDTTAEGENADRCAVSRIECPYTTSVADRCSVRVAGARGVCTAMATAADPLGSSPSVAWYVNASDLLHTPGSGAYVKAPAAVGVRSPRAAPVSSAVVT